MTDDVIDITDRGSLDRSDAMRLQATELERTVDLLRSLGPDDWSAPTACPAWDVHHMYLHVLGACEAGASMREDARQMGRAWFRRRRDGGPLEAALSAVQVEARADVSPPELVQRLEAVAPSTVRARSSMPGVVRRFSMKVDGPVVERWTLAYLTDTIYLRDLWMHRVDACWATGREMVLTADHDGLIVADVVAEWARRHRRPFSLVLTGVAGGAFRSAGPAGEEGPRLELDAVAFCRTLAGRDDGAGLLTTVVPF